MSRRFAIWIEHGDPAAVAEAWRAAVGVSLRGARVVVATAPGTAEGGAGAVRARSTLALFGHEVDGTLAAALEADVIELWRDGREVTAATDATATVPATAAMETATGRSRAVLHLVRAGRAAMAVAARDRVLQLGQPADVDHDAVLDALAAADAACVW